MSADFEVPKITAYQSKFYQRIEKRRDDPPPPEQEPESRRLSAQETLQVHLATKVSCGKKRMNWNPGALRRLMNGKQEKNSTCEVAEFESQKGERL